VLRAMLAAEAPALQLVEGAGPLAACEAAGDGARGRDGQLGGGRRGQVGPEKNREPQALAGR
jgi:hypothetical protein